MNPQKVIKQHLDGQHVMQLATVHNAMPWCASLYYILGDDGALYWASIPSRRHSIEILNNPCVAAAIVAKSEVDERVAGIQIEGTAKRISLADEIRPIAIKYAERFRRTPQWIEDFTSGKTEHCLYKLTPKKYVLFDENTFPNEAPHEFTSL